MLSLKLRKTWLCVKLVFLVLPLIKDVLMKVINDFVVQGRVVRRPDNGNPLESFRVIFFVCILCSFV